MIRRHGMETGELGTWLALILGVTGAIGVLSGGYLSDRFGKTDARWYVWFPLIFLLISALLSGLAFSIDSPYLALSLLILPGTFLNAYLGNVIAVTHGLVGQNMRATASAILFFILNIIGLGLGPWSVGLLSDFLYPTLGDASLGVALTSIVPSAMLVAAFGFYYASRYLKMDLQLTEISSH